MSFEKKNQQYNISDRNLLDFQNRVDVFKFLYLKNDLVNNFSLFFDFVCRYNYKNVFLLKKNKLRHFVFGPFF